MVIFCIHGRRFDCRLKRLKTQMLWSLLTGLDAGLQNWRQARVQPLPPVASQIPLRACLPPWSNHGDDRRRYHIHRIEQRTQLPTDVASPDGYQDYRQE
jgi:hypothetical protein